MTPFQSAVVHLVIALAGIAAVCLLAARGTIAGSDAFTVVVGVLVGAGVLAGANLTTSGSSSPPAPPPAPTVKVAPPPTAPPAQ